MLTYLSKAVADGLGKLASIKIIGPIFKVLKMPFSILGFLRILMLIILAVVLFSQFLLPIFRKVKGGNIMRGNRIDVKSIFVIIIITVLSCISKAIADALGKLASIKIIGPVFKVLRMPFSILGFLRFPMFIILAVVLFFKFLLPIFRKVKGAVKNNKAAKRNRRAEDACMQDMQASSWDYSTSGQYQQEIRGRDDVPSKIDF